MSQLPMTCDVFDATLPEYLDDSLDRDARIALEAHAGDCARCGSLLADLSALTGQARALPDLVPARDLWPDIATQLDTPVVALPAARLPDASTRSRFLTPAWLAAAAAVLIAATATLTTVVTRTWGPRTSAATVAGNVGSGTPGTAPVPNAVPSTVASAPAASDSGTANGAPAPAPAAPSPRLVNAAARRSPAIPVDRIYDREIAQLDAIVHDRRSQLDSTTIAVIENNLRIIDHAIAQSRAALARDPNSRFLHDQLNDALDQKVSLLRTVAFLPAHT